MKKYLLLVFVFVSTFGFSQQVLKRITDTPNYTIVDLYVFRNGTSTGNVVGNSNFDMTSIQNIGDIVISNSIGNLTYTNNSGISGASISIPNEIICNGTFETDQTVIGNGTLTNFVSNQNPSEVFDISIPIISSNRDEINDGNNQIDLLHMQYSIPKILNNNSAIPNGTWAICGSRDGVVISRKNVILRFNGTTWVLQTTYPNGNPVPDLQDVCGSLSVSEIENNENKISIFPNPTNNFITIQNRQNLTDNFEFKIVDLTGRIVKNGNSKFNEQINIESLTCGNYVIQIQTDSNQNFTQKIIKN